MDAATSVSNMIHLSHVIPALIQTDTFNILCIKPIPTISHLLALQNLRITRDSEESKPKAIKILKNMNNLKNFVCRDMERQDKSCIIFSLYCQKDPPPMSLLLANTLP